MDEQLTQDDIDSAIDDLRSDFEEKLEELQARFDRDLGWAKDEWLAEREELDDKIYDLEMKVEEYRRELGEQE